MLTYKNPNLRELKSACKELASEIRTLRNEAQTVNGMDRWTLQHRANGIGEDFRVLHLAYCLLRGRKISECESETSLIENLPSGKLVADTAMRYFRPRRAGAFLEPEEAEETATEYAEAQAFFHQSIVDEMKAWRKQLTLNSLKRQAVKRAAA